MTELTAEARAAAGNRRRWIALGVVCLAMLMNTLDGSVVNVALPAIQNDLHIAQANLTWVVNAYLISFGSFLLLAGRLGDLVGRKRVFLSGVTIFTLASVAVRPRHGREHADRRALRAGPRRRGLRVGDHRDDRRRSSPSRPSARRP